MPTKKIPQSSTESPEVPKPKSTKTKIAKMAKETTDSIANNVEKVKEKVTKSSKTKKETPVNEEVPLSETVTADEPKVESPESKTIKKRTFKVVRVTRNDKTENFEGGRFQSKTPAGAARKAANQACKTLYADEDNCSIDIVIQETSKNHSNKEYSYRATRTLNTKDVPFKGTSGEVSIPFKYAMKLNSLKKSVTGAVVVGNEVPEEAEVCQ